MKEIDDRGPEFGLLSERVKGGKHHNKIGAAGIPALLSPVLAVAAAGLITLAVISDRVETGGFGDGGGGYYGGGLPQPPVIQEVEEPEEPEESEEPEEPESPPPTTPPPTTPPPTTPPPTTPPPTTPPPTTPPPTTPPPVYYPIYEDEEEDSGDEESFTEPSMSTTIVFYGETDSDTWDIRCNYTLDFGSADSALINAVVETDNADYGIHPFTRAVYKTGSSTMTDTFAIEPPRPTSPSTVLTVTVTGTYSGKQSGSLDVSGGTAAFPVG